MACNIDNDIPAAVLSALQYYSVFSYPLKADEIYLNMPAACAFSKLLVTLEDMDESGMIYRHDGFYSIDPQVEKYVERRSIANAMAVIQKAKAARVGKFIYKFPFVRFVGISGGLSKGYADKNSDLDFFIVTTKDRLWISRTILHLFKKFTFLVGRQHDFCMNYFVDEHSMGLTDRNRFTAIELATMIPVAGYETYIQMMSSNLWVNDHLPNAHISGSDINDRYIDKTPAIKAATEAILNGIDPNALNAFLMRLTDKKWKKKWSRKNYPQEDYDIAFKTTLHISKNHPANNQKKVLKALEKLENKNKANEIS